MMTDAVTVTGLVVQRGSRAVIRSLSCAIRPGSMTGLIGPSGSGKTTLMRAIVGVQRIESGTVEVFGEPDGLKEQTRQIAGSLSGGQYSRVSLACALVAEPRLLILDAPTVGLDPVLRSQLWTYCADLAGWWPCR